MNGEESCTFVFDPETDCRQGINSPLSETWECPHERYGEYNLCPYHLSSAQRRQSGLTSDAFRQRFIEDVAAAGRTSKDFIGADLTGLNLRYATVTSSDEYPINFAHARVNGTLDLTSASITQPLFLGATSVEILEAPDCQLDGPLYLINARLDEIDFSNAEIDSLEMQGSVVRNKMKLRGAAVASGLRCLNAEFDGYVRLEGFSCAETVSFQGAKFHKDADFDGAVVESLDLREVTATRLDLRKLNIQGDLLAQDAEIEFLDIGQTDIGGELSLKRSRVDGATDIRGASFDRLDISRASFGAALNLGRAEIANEIVGRNCEINALLDASYSEFGRVILTGAQFNGSVQFRHCKFMNDVSFGSVEFGESADFTDAEFHDSVTFLETTFSEQATFKNCSIQDRLELRPKISGGPIEIRFEFAEIGSGDVSCREGMVYDFTRATLGDIVFEAETLPDTCFDHIRILNTRFDGFDFGQYKQQLREAGWKLHPTTVSTSRGNNEKSLSLLENTYLKAKNGAKQEGDNKAAAEFFRKEMIYRRKQHAAIAISATEPAVSRVISAGRWIANGTLSITAGYGERPSRVFTASIAIVLAFSIIYATLPSFPIATGSYGERYILFSLQSFVTFIVGSPADEPVSLLVQSLSAVQGFIGAFFVALFVFALTRSIHR